MANQPEVDAVLQKLMAIGTTEYVLIDEKEVESILSKAYRLFASQPMCLQLDVPISICGDLHGQLNDLMRIFGTIGFPPTVNYLFLGDYVDRGPHSIEIVLLLLCIKLKYPDNFFLLRGNHETQIVSRIYGFHDDICRRYSTPKLFLAFQEVFTVMPLTAIVGGRLFCTHGGLSPDIIKCPNSLYESLNSIVRPLRDPPNPSLPLDLLWADPNAGVKQFKFSIRGVSCNFGEDVVNSFCTNNKIDLIVRAHQVVQDGYEFFANKKLVTLFSAPHYCGQFDNAAAVMMVSDKLLCSFKVLQPKFPPLPPPKK